MTAAVDGLLIYGATGHSGRLVTRAAVDLGLRPILAGRSDAEVARVAAAAGLPYRIATVDDAVALDAMLRDVAVLVNAAGPFGTTAMPLADACLRRGAHYLDITGEVDTIEALAGRHAEARRRGVMVLPAVGFDVVPSDCLAAHVARRMPGATRLRLGLRGLSSVTPGSAATLFRSVDRGLVRRAGRLVAMPLGSLERIFDYGAGPVASVNVSWGDLAAAWYTTGIPDIETYVEATPLFRAVLAGCRAYGWLWRTAPWQAALARWADLLPARPLGTPVDEMVVVAEAEGPGGRRAVARIRTPEAYAFTGVTASRIAQRVLAGDLEPGFQTPARVYGADLVLGFPGVSREDLA